MNKQVEWLQANQSKYNISDEDSGLYHRPSGGVMVNQYPRPKEAVYNIHKMKEAVLNIPMPTYGTNARGQSIRLGAKRHITDGGSHK